MHDAIPGERRARRLDQRCPVAPRHRGMTKGGTDAGSSHVRGGEDRQHAIGGTRSRDIDIADFAMRVGRPHETAVDLARQRRVVDKPTLATQELFVLDSPSWLVLARAVRAAHVPISAGFSPSPTRGEGTARGPANSKLAAKKQPASRRVFGTRRLEAFPLRRMFCIIAGLDPAVHLLTKGAGRA